jgi:AcrR family transcriptional regulator
MDGASPAPLELLPRGRHGLSREQVQESQRTRLLEAMIHLSAERGYPAVTLSMLVRRAHVARRTFYENFADREACFLAAYDYTAAQIIEPLLAAFDPVADIRERASVYMGAVLEALSQRPAVARMLVIEMGAGGPQAIRHRLEMHQRIAGAIVALNRQTRELGFDVPQVSAERALAIVGAVVEVLHAKLESDGAEELPVLREELSAVVAALITGVG